MADAINRHPDTDVLYSDEDKLDARGQRYGAYFKPDWNPELLYGQNFISHLGVYRTSLVRQLQGFRPGFEGSQDYDLALRATAVTKGPIVHVPHVLYHWRVYPGAGTFSSTQLSRALDAARRAIKEQLATLGIEASVGDAGHYYHRVVRKSLAIWPPVSVVMRMRERAEFLSDCIDGLLDKTDYPDLEVMVVCDESLGAAHPPSDRDIVEARCSTRAQFGPGRSLQDQKRGGATHIGRDHPVSRQRPDGERAGLAQGDGVIGEAAEYRRCRRKAPPFRRVRCAWRNGARPRSSRRAHSSRSSERILGLHGRLLLAQDVSCVTAACMALPRAAFEHVGGFDERDLAPSFNDVDLCLRIRQAGYRIDLDASRSSSSPRDGRARRQSRQREAARPSEGNRAYARTVGECARSRSLLESQPVPAIERSADQFPATGHATLAREGDMTRLYSAPDDMRADEQSAKRHPLLEEFCFWPPWAFLH